MLSYQILTPYLAPQCSNILVRWVGRSVGCGAYVLDTQ